jgi:hypothetical protein
MINPDWVTSAESNNNVFTLILLSVNTTSDLSSTNPGNLAFGTSLTITSASGTSGQISQIWYSAVEEVRRGQSLPDINLVTLGASLTKRTIIAS